MINKQSKVTIQDVAKTAGVSVSTVSRVLNQKVDVSAETQNRIQQVITQMGYTSNLAARSMRSSRKNLIGLIVPDVEFPYSIEVMKGVNRAIADKKYDLLVYTTGGFQKRDSALREQHYISLLNGTITDGLIVVTPSAAHFVSTAPIVSIDPHVLDENYSTLLADHYSGAVELMHYLVSLHHQRIGFISGRSGFQSNERFRAYRDVLSEAGIEYDPDLVAAGDFSVRTGAECARKLLALKTRPTAIFAANDQSALGVYTAAEEMGIAIPEDLSLAGFDDIPEAKYYNLTTVRQPMDEMGAMAVELLIKLIEEDNVGRDVHQLPARLVVRGSCQALVD